MSETSEKLGVAIIGGIIGAIVIVCLNKKYDHRLEQKEEKLDKKIEQAEKSLDDISTRVEKAVKTVYDGAAKDAFKRKLDDFDFKSIAVKECRLSMEAITESELSRLIRDRFSSQVTKVLEDEIKRCFQQRAEDIAKGYLNEEYVDRTAKAYIRNEVYNVLELQTDKMLANYEIDDVINDYLDDHSSKVEGAVKKAAAKAVKELLDDIDDVRVEYDPDDEESVHITFC